MANAHKAHPDEEVDAVGNAENGKELGESTNAESSEPVVAANLVNDLPVVGIAEDATVVVVVRGGSVAVVLHTDGNGVCQCDSEESDLGLHASSFLFCRMVVHFHVTTFWHGSVLTTLRARSRILLLAGRIVGHKCAEFVRHLVLVLVLKINYKVTSKQITYL